MQQWLNDALNSSDARDRIAVTTGVSKGVFGSLHLYKGSSFDQDACNDSDYYEDRKCA